MFLIKEIINTVKQKLIHNRLYKDFSKELKKYNELSKQKGMPLAEKSHLFPCLHDASSKTNIEPIYFYQDTWAFEKIVDSNPSHHYDIGSQHKFVAFLSKVLNITMVDIRPLSLDLESINFIKGDILNLPFPNNSIDSLSSLCVIEHIGLGRYGDKLDPQGTEKAVVEIDRVIKPGGLFYFSVPITDKNIINFNAHRSFSEGYILSLFHNFDVLEKKYIIGNDFIDKRKKNIWSVGCYILKKKNGNS